jgi:hypothetical protein
MSKLVLFVLLLAVEEITISLVINVNLGATWARRDVVSTNSSILDFDCRVLLVVLDTWPAVEFGFNVEWLAHFPETLFIQLCELFDGQLRRSGQLSFWRSTGPSFSLAFSIFSCNPIIK